MVVVPLSKMPDSFDVDPNAPHVPGQGSDEGSLNLLRVASAATLVAGGALLFAGKRRAGLIAAATGVSLAMLEQQETLKKWWVLLPGYIVQVQKVITEVEGAVEQFAEQREKLGNVLGHK